MTGYVYNVDTKKVVAEIKSENQATIEKYVEENYDLDTHGLTYSPAFGFSGGLIESDADVVEV